MEINFSVGDGFPVFTDTHIAELAGILSKAFHTLLLNNIRTNKFGYTLKKGTLQARNSRGFVSLRPLIASGQYLNSIIENSGVVFIKEGTVANGSIEFAELGDLLEYGRADKGFGGFPHWRPTLEEFIPKMEEIIVDYYITNVLNKSK